MATPAWPGGQEPGAGPHGREAEPGTGPRFCRPRGWPRLRRRWRGERGTTWHPCSGPTGRLRWQIPRSPLAGVSEAYGARTQAFLLDKSHLNPSSLWPWASHTTLMSLFPHLQNGAKNSSLRRVARMILLGSFSSRGWCIADSVHGHCGFPPPGKALGACQDGKPGGKRMTRPARAIADSQPSPARGLRLGQQHKNNTLPEQPGPQCKPCPPTPPPFTVPCFISLSPGGSRTHTSSVPVGSGAETSPCSCQVTPSLLSETFSKLLLPLVLKEGKEPEGTSKAFAFHPPQYLFCGLSCTPLVTARAESRAAGIPAPPNLYQ
ncbi:uncharacterized protein LOC106006178 [Mustela putorius furo]|uniref:Uncharacterized protein LOC106006178 n=1 Tax=Mustela putorius furo TaxID=9669 RepID=A0A8U0RNI4_MUSPF|nr:uncharacterized protein LOC106006178 [Mustela putorius furo]XP_044927871.1 uncharacterized protein LOC106006178 [Mustela putorius furo]